MHICNYPCSLTLNLLTEVQLSTCSEFILTVFIVLTLISSLHEYASCISQGQIANKEMPVCSPLYAHKTKVSLHNNVHDNTVICVPTTLCHSAN